MDPRLNISLLAINYPPEPTGIAPYTGALAAGLNRLGHDVTVNASHPHYPAWRIDDGYGQWTRVEDLDGVHVRRALHYVPHSPRGIRRLLSELTFGVRLVFAHWGRPKVVIAVSPSLFSTFLAVLRLRCTPRRPVLIVWVQDIYTLGLAETGEAGGLIQRITRWVESRTLRSADEVVVIHRRFADYVRQEFGVEATRIDVVRNWTHLPPSGPVDRAAAREALNWPRQVALAVHTGNMGTKQGLENLVDAARIADQRGAAVHFVLVGDGGERRSLEERAHGISRITFVDPLGEKEFRSALAAADVLIVNEKPGVSGMAVPSKLTSYFDAGRPIAAATDASGTTASEIAAAGAGVVVPAGEPGALLDAILELNANAEASAQFGQNGRRYREEVLDERVAIERWASVIGATISKRRLGRGVNRPGNAGGS